MPFTGDAESTLGVTLANLKYEVGRLLAWGPPTEWTNEDADDFERILIAALQQFYWPSAILTSGVPHAWSFMEPLFTLSTDAPYSTGTIAIASGVVTLSGGTFPSWADYGEITVDGSVYMVLSRDSGTQVTLQDTGVDVTAGASYVISHYRYALPTNWGGQRGPLTYRTSDNTFSTRVVEFLPYDEWRKRKQNWSTERGQPIYATNAITRVQDEGSVSTDDADLETQELLLWPTPDAAYFLSVRYQVNANTLDPNLLLGAHLYPHAIRLLVLSEAERNKDHPTPKYAEQAREALLTAIRMDKTRYQSTTVGYIGDESDYPGDYRDYPRYTVTHENQ